MMTTLVGGQASADGLTKNAVLRGQNQIAPKQVPHHNQSTMALPLLSLVLPKESQDVMDQDAGCWVACREVVSHAWGRQGVITAALLQPSNADQVRDGIHQRTPSKWHENIFSEPISESEPRGMCCTARSEGWCQPWV